MIEQWQHLQRDRKKINCLCRIIHAELEKCNHKNEEFDSGPTIDLLTRSKKQLSAVVICRAEWMVYIKKRYGRKIPGETEEDKAAAVVSFKKTEDD